MTLDFALTSGQQMVAEAVRDFVSTRFIVFRDERKAKPVERP